MKMFIKKVMSASIVSIILLIIFTLFTFVTGGYNPMNVVYVFMIYIVQITPVVFLFGIPASVLIDILTRRLNNKGLASIFLYILFASIVPVLYFSTQPGGGITFESFMEFTTRVTIELLYVLFIFLGSIIFWFFDKKIGNL
ncbi:hypothetical protein AM500_04780 [Bacillus sp. FJAT-18017]|uniref:hypothetical protein n=1 Tax=Bacillus sp. FJAT-18017 TaxID=1705566 RepID=UPI0006AECD6D|nr:hypothetical protein [Bacillus sp. FJAT-18017]ALC89180.1 hypothetical protein AM500_04780 [Bacillus sp. FJAT-18017]